MFGIIAIFLKNRKIKLFAGMASGILSLILISLAFMIDDFNVNILGQEFYMSLFFIPGFVGAVLLFFVHKMSRTAI